MTDPNAQPSIEPTTPTPASAMSGLLDLASHIATAPAAERPWWEKFLSIATEVGGVAVQAGVASPQVKGAVILFGLLQSHNAAKAGE